MYFKFFLRNIFPLFSLGLFFSSIDRSNAVDFSLEINSSSLATPSNPFARDILKPGPITFIEGVNLGLSVMDDLNALSYGQDSINNPLYFSVDRMSSGLPGTDVNSQTPAQAADIYRTLPPNGSNKLILNESQLGLTNIPSFRDDIDALEMDSSSQPYIYFSASANGPADHNKIFISTGEDGMKATFAEGSTMGIDSGDDIDALVLRDTVNPSFLNFGVDEALFSLSRDSTSTFTGSGTTYMPGVKGFLSPADILYTNFNGSFSLWEPAANLGLLSTDDVNALDTTTPVPEPFTILGAGAGLGFLGLFRKIAEKKKKKDSPEV